MHGQDERNLLLVCHNVTLLFLTCTCLHVYTNVDRVIILCVWFPLVRGIFAWLQVFVMHEVHTQVWRSEVVHIFKIEYRLCSVSDIQALCLFFGGCLLLKVLVIEGCPLLRVSVIGGSTGGATCKLSQLIMWFHCVASRIIKRLSKLI